MFVSESSEKCSPFFMILKKVKDFVWTNRSQVVFEELKKRMTGTLLMEKAKPEEVLILYMTISGTYLRFFLIRKHIKVQKPIYYESEVLLTQPTIEKFALAMTKA